MEAILQGWLTKSPPEKKQFKLFGSKWRKRYFVLYAPPTVVGIPDARTAILEYYSSKKLHNKCGTINLSDCEEVLSNLDSEIFEHVFGLRTMHKGQLRTYYLAAESEVEMNKWVNRLCQVLGLTENDDGLSPPLHHQTRPGLQLRSLHQTTQPLGIPATTRQTFQPRPTTHQVHPNFGSSSGGLLSPAPPPLRPVPSTPGAPFSRLNISEPNLLDAMKGYPPEDTLRMASPPGSSRLASPPGPMQSSLKSAGSFPELDRFSPTARKAGHLPLGEGREFMELPPIPPEKTGAKVALASVEPVRDAAYDLPKQKYYERNDTNERETTNRSTTDDWYNSPPSRYNTQQPSNDDWYNSPPSRYNSVQPPQRDFPNMPLPDKYKSMGGDWGVGASEVGFPSVPPLKPKRFTQDNDDCYNVPRSGAKGNDRQTGVANWNQGPPNGSNLNQGPPNGSNWNQGPPNGSNWNQGPPNGSNWSEQQFGNWGDYPQNFRPDSEDCYNVPKSSHQDRRKHVSQGGEEEFYNIPKAQQGACDLPRQRSDRRSYGGRGCTGRDQDQGSRYRSSHDPSEYYDMPKRPESGHGDLGLYNIPGLSMSSTVNDNDFYNRPSSVWMKTERQTPLNGGALPPMGEEGHPHTHGSNDLASRSAYGLGPSANDPYNVPPPPSSAVLSASSSSERRLPEPDDSKQTTLPAPLPSANDRTSIVVDRKIDLPATDVTSDSVAGDKLEESQGRRAEEEEEGGSGKSTELKKTPSGAYKQNRAVQSSTSLHKKQGVSASGLPLHDSIRFTQRTKSFKRSIPSQDRTTLPLPVKRIVERSESSSSSSSDDGSDQNNSNHSKKRS